MPKLLPPTLFVILLTVTVTVGLAVPVFGPLGNGVRLGGVVAIAAGAFVTVASAGLFNRVGTNIDTFADPDQLVDHGAFRFTRNPMYLGFTIVLVGAATLVGTASAFVGPIVFFAAAERWYVPFEERRMASVFGGAYDEYRRRVPRWIGIARP
jgi:protein-S-isoprenylcysteine O-methyltransferase Ste14